MPRRKPKPIPWGDVEPGLSFVKVLLSVAKAIDSMCDTDAAKGRTLWALIVYFFTSREDLVPLTGRAQAAFNGLKANMDASRRAAINGSKGGNPNLMRDKGATNDEQSTRQGTDKGATNDEQSTRQGTQLQDTQEGFSPADTFDF